MVAVALQHGRSVPSSAYCIQLSGLVQGVGFRPLVYQLATEWGLRGWVMNGTGGLKIHLNADQATAYRFLDELLAKAPPLAKIQRHWVEETPFSFFENFAILESDTTDSFSLLLAPDFALCEHCRSELHKPANRRYRYPFITCTQCGPRYSITEQLPYDRPLTSMASFAQCQACANEYQDPTNRRFFSQTNSCEACGPRLSWYQADPQGVRQLSNLHDSRWILPRITWALQTGNIVAVKGIGGFLLLCDATHEKAVSTLRQRKHRPTKPFAVLFPTLAQVEQAAVLSTAEQQALTSVEAPIVLVQKRKNYHQITDVVAPQQSHWGVMLPYAPLLELIAHDFGKPLVATSGNLSGNPIIYDNTKALSELNQVADYILTHNRDIMMPQDDSVIRFSAQHQQKIILRRARGLAPNTSFCDSSTTSPWTLSLGASLKSTFAVRSHGQVFVSQYLGDLESFDTQQNFKTVLAHFQKILRVNPQHATLLCDVHEGYFSTQLAQQFAAQESLPLQKIQHHQAHLAAVLAEHQLLSSQVPILGIVWDGTGYGTDGHIWGGEFFVFQNQEISPQRIHFEYFASLLGDKMPREPRLSALSLCASIPSAQPILKAKFSEREWVFYQKILISNTLKTSSVGRIFDGVASLLGLIDIATYEGEGALLLEEKAQQYFRQMGTAYTSHYMRQGVEGTTLSTQALIEGVVQDLLHQEPVEKIAAKFHCSLVKIIEQVAQQLTIHSIAFSGGVFQNAVLVDLLISQMGQTHQLYFHNTLSPNDENISFGQLMMSSLVTNSL